jgi:hypothetical protein
VADARLNAYLILLAPALARIDGVTDDPADVEMAEAILVAAESADGVGLTRSEIAARAGVDADDQRFNARLDLLARTGALRHLRGDKKHQVRYLPDPVALLAAEILTRLGQDHGAEELHSMLVAAADRLEATFHDDPGGRHAPSVPEVAALIGKLSALLHAYALRMETAVIAGTYEELIRARTGSSTSLRGLRHIPGRGDSPQPSATRSRCRNGAPAGHVPDSAPGRPRSRCDWARPGPSRADSARAPPARPGE